MLYNTDMTTEDKIEDKQAFVKNFMTGQQKLADDVGMGVFEYMAQAEGGILRDTMIKLGKHAQAHPNVCPADCAFQASLTRLKKRYGVA